MIVFGFGEFGQPGRLVDRITDHRVFEPGQRADMPGDRSSGRHPDPELGLAEHADQFVVQLPCRGQCRTCGIRVFQWCAEDTQCGVTEELVDETPVLAGGFDDDAEKLVEQTDNLARRAGRGQSGGAHQVDEQDCDVALLAAQFGAALQRPPGDVLTDVTAEQISHALAFTEFAHHVVESGLQQAQFGGVVDLHVSVVVTALHLTERPAQLSQRVRDRHGGQNVSGQSDHQGGDGGEKNRREEGVGRGVQQ